MNRLKIKYTISKWSALAVIFYLSGCAALQEIANIQKPTAKVDRVRFTGMSFDTVDLTFDVTIQNPNPIAATLAGFDYDFLIENKSFLTGNQTNQTTIAGNGSSLLNIPISIPFKQLSETYKAISQQDSAGFQLNSGVTVELPVLGNTRIPIRLRPPRPCWTSQKSPAVSSP